MLSAVQLDHLRVDLKEYLSQNLTIALINLNRTGELTTLLDLLGYPREKEESLDESLRDSHNGKILVVGASKVKEKELLGIAKNFGLDKDRFEFCLSYDRSKYFDFEKTRWNPNYSSIMVGPIPHSSVDNEDYSSRISKMEHKDGYPPVYRLGSNQLKITKTGFKDALQKMMAEGVIA